MAFFAVLLRQWSGDVVLLTNGPHNLTADQLERVKAFGIPIIETPGAALDAGEDGRLRRVRLDDGKMLDRDALFFYVGWRLRNDVARMLGCRLGDDGSVAVDPEQATTVDGLYAPATACSARSSSSAVTSPPAGSSPTG